MKYEDAVQFIRQNRGGDFNNKELLYMKYCSKIWMCFKTPVAIEAAVVIIKTRMSNVALVVELEIGPNLLFLLSNTVV